MALHDRLGNRGVAQLLREGTAMRLIQREVGSTGGGSVTPLATWGSGVIQVPQGHGGGTGSARTDTFFIYTPVSVTIAADASYLGPSDNVSDWSVQLFRSTWWGEDEAIGSRQFGTVPGTISYSLSVPLGPSRSYYLRFRNASNYEPIRVTWTVS